MIRYTIPPPDPARELYIAQPPMSEIAVRPFAVVDCSALAAILFDEPERDEAERLISGHQWCAPNLLDHEFLNVALIKYRRVLAMNEVARVLQDYLALSLRLHSIDLAGQFTLAERYELTAYDAAYLWLANDLRAPLITFDRKLALAAQRHLHALH